jgi:multiple sugar transport system ATP-binding protein
MAGVVLENIRKSYGNVDVIKGIDLEINDGEFTVFVGPSGCGKSTLLRMIAGLEDISAGDMFIGEKRVNELPPKDRSVAMVFQSYAIFPHMTVRENIGFGLSIAKTPKAEKDSKVQEAARILQMEHLLDRRPSQLSDGPLPANQKCFYLMNHCQILMPRCAWICGWKLANCTSNWAQP